MEQDGASADRFPGLDLESTHLPGLLRPIPHRQASLSKKTDFLWSGKHAVAVCASLEMVTNKTKCV